MTLVKHGSLTCTKTAVKDPQVAAAGDPGGGKGVRSRPRSLGTAWDKSPVQHQGSYL
jgi:hypothetical protein